jgi:putative transposase
VAAGLKLGEIDGMASEPTKYYLPAETIDYAVWLYHVFSLSLRDIELILAERGVFRDPPREHPRVVNSPSDCADAVHDRAPSGTWMKCLSESSASYTIPGGRSTSMVSFSTSWFRIGGTLRQRSVSFMRLLQGLHYKPRRLVTDGLRSYGVAHRALRRRSGFFRRTA